MRIISLLAALLVAMTAAAQGNIIKTPVPERPEGQEDMIAFRTAPMDSVRIGFVGTGMRGSWAVKRYTNLDSISIKAVCDKHEDRAKAAAETVVNAGLPAPDVYSGLEGYKELCERPDIDLVYICTDWVNHTPIALYAMEHGKHVAIEVPAATSLEECWQLVDTAEKTRRHCMMLENCIYDFFEFTTLNMAKQGVFGDIVHVEGSYIHNLAPYWHEYEGNWRLDFNEKHRGDIYPTHGMGPAAQLVNLHRGNRMLYLTSMDSKAFTGPECVKKATGRDCPEFQNADHTMTNIQTANGQTMHIQHDIMNPRPYTRMYQLVGTKGFANKYPVEGFSFYEVPEFEGMPAHDKIEYHNFVPDSIKDAIMEHYKHPIQRGIEEKARKVGGHGGMDFIMDYRLIYCLLNGLPLDQDVYDLAEWCSLGELSRISIENNSAPVEVPDFTRGGWQKLNGYHHYVKGE